MLLDPIGCPQQLHNLPLCTPLEIARYSDTKHRKKPLPISTELLIKKIWSIFTSKTSCPGNKERKWQTGLSIFIKSLKQYLCKYKPCNHVVICICSLIFHCSCSQHVIIIHKATEFLYRMLFWHKGNSFDKAMATHCFSF